MLRVPRCGGETPASHLLPQAAHTALLPPGLRAEGGATHLPAGAEDSGDGLSCGDLPPGAPADLSPGDQTHSLPPPHQALPGGAQGGLCHGQGQPQDSQEADSEEMVF